MSIIHQLISLATCLTIIYILGSLTVDTRPAVSCSTDTECESICLTDAECALFRINQ